MLKLMTKLYSATDIRASVGESSSTEYIWNIGMAFSESLNEGGTVVVVRSGSADGVLTHALLEGLLLMGRDVVVAGEGGDGEVRATIATQQADGGVLVESTGDASVFAVSLYDNTGTKLTDTNGLVDVINVAEAGNFLPAPSKGKISQLVQ